MPCVSFLRTHLQLRYPFVLDAQTFPGPTWAYLLLGPRMAFLLNWGVVRTWEVAGFVSVWEVVGLMSAPVPWSFSSILL